MQRTSLAASAGLLAAMLTLTAEDQPCPKPVPAGQLCITWEHPTQNVDGTPVEGPLTYRLHVGWSSRAYDYRIDIPLTTTKVHGRLHDLGIRQPPGVTEKRLFMAVTAVDIEGDESGYSNEIDSRFARWTGLRPSIVDISWGD